jgi:hypothetical protein
MAAPMDIPSIKLDNPSPKIASINKNETIF